MLLIKPHSHHCHISVIIKAPNLRLPVFKICKIKEVFSLLMNMHALCQMLMHTSFISSFLAFLIACLLRCCTLLNCISLRLQFLVSAIKYHNTDINHGTGLEYMSRGACSSEHINDHVKVVLVLQSQHINIDTQKHLFNLSRE